MSIGYDSIIYSFARGFNVATLMDIRDTLYNSFTTCYGVVKWRVISSNLSDPEVLSFGLLENRRSVVRVPPFDMQIVGGHAGQFFFDGFAIQQIFLLYSKLLKQ